ncbi:DUF202 domain-containing protein [Actinocorallia sp. B10E7]|uniref:DUF202 domain-containing protein n=1 Tax=Actinocorallia sp. B10E7 TaxID=3153558 RepID=UPI00325DB689
MTSRSEPPGISDPGAPFERTALAWQRTALLIAVNGALLARATPALGAQAIVLGGATVAAAVLIWVLASLSYRRGRGKPTSSVLTAHARATRALTVLIVAIAVCDLLAILLYR